MCAPSAYGPGEDGPAWHNGPPPAGRALGGCLSNCSLCTSHDEPLVVNRYDLERYRREAVLVEREPQPAASVVSPSTRDGGRHVGGTDPPVDGSTILPEIKATPSPGWRKRSVGGPVDLTVVGVLLVGMDPLPEQGLRKRSHVSRLRAAQTKPRQLQRSPLTPPTRVDTLTGLPAP